MEHLLRPPLNNYVWSALSGLRQVLAIESPLYFLFRLKISFCTQDI